MTTPKINKATDFKDLEWYPHDANMGGKRARTDYENGYGASVIQTPFSYGGDEGKYELAVMKKGHGICYDTPITEDVEGYLSEDDVTNLLKRIATLPFEEGK